MSRLGTAASRIALIALGTLVAIALAEVGLRLVSPHPYYGYTYIPPQQGLFMYDPLLGWVGRPHACAQFANLDFDVRVTLDGAGYRNSAPPYVNGKCNVVALGDSYAWGWGVKDDELFSRRLNQRATDVNLYNLSAPGYGTDQELLALERFFETHPSRAFAAVILLLSANDLEDVTHDVRYTYPKPKFVLERGALRLTNVPVPELKRAEYDRSERSYQRVGRGALTSLHLYNLVRFRVGRALDLLGGTSRGSPSEGFGRQDSRSVDLDLTARLLEQVAAICAERAATFHVVLLITSDTTPDSWQWLNLGQRLEEAGIGHSRFSSRGSLDAELWYDRHFSARGHRRLARHIFSALREAGVR